jgi:hypothetical protein
MTFSPRVPTAPRPPAAFPLLRTIALSACAVLLGGCYVEAGAGGAVAVEAPPPPGAATEVDFETALSPYGEWIDTPEYGRVWRPSEAAVGADFTPYATGGQWAYDDQGWVFETAYPWGWAPYHYGRWYYGDRGWVWMPGDEWAPAWVDWRYGDDYLGWVPLGPPGYVVVESRWAFVGAHDFGRPGIGAYLLPPERVHVAFGATVGVDAHAGGHAWSPGPSPEHIARVTGAPVVRAKATAAPRPRTRTPSRTFRRGR